MPELKMTEPKLNCPTSGPMLRAAIHAFGLRNGGKLISENTLVGSSDSQRSERRYLSGEGPTPDDVRGRVIGIVAAAIVNCGLVTDRSLPPKANHPSLHDAIEAGLASWAATWDKVYRQESEGWPYLPRSLAGFVLGREVVMDLVLRVAAVMHLTEADPKLFAFHAARDRAGRSILQHVMTRGGRACDYPHAPIS